jgi:hypothetical protein
MKDAFPSLKTWFTTNKLLNICEKYFKKFITKNKNCIHLNIGRDDKTGKEVRTTEFLGIQLTRN